jgi:NitT/TauT family transport system substrate-binding protein
MDIDSVEDLNLRRISVWEGGFRPAFDAFFEAQGIHPTIVPQYYSVNLFLHRGVAACVAMEYNEYHMIYQAGVDREEMITFRMRDYGFGVPEDGIYCLDTTFRNQPEVCRAVAEASLEGWRYAAAHPDEALDIVMKYVREAHIPTNRPHMDWMLRTILATVIPEPTDPWRFGELRPEDYELAVSLLKNSGVIKTAPAFDAFRGKEAPRVP